MGSRRIWRHVDAAFMEESAIRYGKARTGEPPARDVPGAVGPHPQTPEPVTR